MNNLIMVTMSYTMVIVIKYTHNTHTDTYIIVLLYYTIHTMHTHIMIVLINA